MRIQLFLRTLMVLALSLCSAAAVDFSKLTGKWTGERAEIENGVGAYAKVTIQAMLGTSGGLLLVEKGKWPDLGRYTWTHNLRSNGKYVAIAKTSSGYIFATTTGKWKESKGRIVISGQNWNFTGTADFKGSLRRLSNGKLEYKGHSGTSEVVISARHR